MAARTTAAKATETVDPEIEAVANQPIEALSEDLNIFQRIAAISKEAGALAPESKGGVPFAFRGVDGTVAHLTPFLNKYGVFLVPSRVDHKVSERELMNVDKATKAVTPSGRVLKTSKVEATYDVYGPDGFGFSVEVPGLADDYADRSTAQAMSVAYRIALLQLFHLPTHTKEPEETGEDVAKITAGINDEQQPTVRGPKAVETAKANQSGPAPTSISRLQAEAKALGRKLGVDSGELNALGEKLSGTADMDVWFNDVLIMEQIRDNLKARAEA